jgi:hypothetical protein
VNAQSGETGRPASWSEEVVGLPRRVEAAAADHGARFLRSEGRPEVPAEALIGVLGQPEREDLRRGLGGLLRPDVITDEDLHHSR